MRAFLLCLTLVLSGFASPALSYPIGYCGHAYGTQCGFGDGYGCGYGYSPGYYATYYRFHSSHLHHPQYSSILTRYESCSCHFGYENGYTVCTPSVSCSVEGGRCQAPCAAQMGN
jgi:hypothetical protein